MKAVVIVLLLALIAGGTLGGLGLVGMGPLAAYVGKAADGETAAAPPPGPKLRNIQLDTIGVPVFEGQSVRARIFFNLQLEVDPAVAPQVSANLPRIQSALLEDMMSYLPYHLRDREQVDAATVQERMLKVARHVMGDAVHGVVVVNAFVQ